MLHRARTLLCLLSAAGAASTAGCSPSMEPTGRTSSAPANEPARRAASLGPWQPIPMAADTGARPDATLPCKSVSYQGCCDGQTVWYCKDKKLYFHRCRTNLSCGWDAVFGLYDCGTTGKADPAGKHPKSCGILLGEAGVPTTDAAPTDLGGDQSTGCGNVPSWGCCDGNTLWYCKSGAARWVNCGLNPSCGWNLGASSYTCGTSGGADPAGVKARSCSSVVHDASLPSTDRGPRPDRGSPDARGLPCGSIPKQGCCDGNTLWWCSANVLHSKPCGGFVCGWNPLVKWYACVAVSSADPSGTYPLWCRDLTADGSVPASDMPVPDLPSPDLPLPDLFVSEDTAPDRATADDLPVPDVAAAAPDHSAADLGDVDLDGDDGCGCSVGRAPTGGRRGTLHLALALALCGWLVRRRGVAPARRVVHDRDGGCPRPTHKVRP